ncbi:MAG TPA: methyltransferase [Actinocatenispora sp.]
MIEPLLGTDGVRRLRDALLAAGYTGPALTDRMDDRTAAAVRAGDAPLVRRWLAGDDPQATLARLFLAGSVEPPARVAAALGGVDVADAVAATLLVPDGDGLRAGVEVHPYGDVDGAEEWWTVADLPANLRGGPLPADHVLGVGGASTTLALATRRTPVGTALDLGTGCGVQALHLSRHAGRVTATDLSARALRYAATTAALSGQDWELLAGDLTAPVAGRRFDLVVSNPPFIVGPAAREHFTYRDSGREGDAVCAELIAAMPGLLADGGYAQFLANWIHPAGGDWAQRLADRLAGTGLDAWIVQREVSTPAEYVRMWLADTTAGAPAASAAAAGDWLDWFAAQGIEAVGFGIVTLRAGGHADPTVRIEDVRQPTDPIGGLVPEWFDRQDFLRAHPGPALLSARLRAAESLALHAESALGPDGWTVRTHRLALSAGARWVEETDELVASVVAGCTGALPLADVLGLLAAAHDLDPAAVYAAALPVVAGLVERGILLPPASAEAGGTRADALPSAGATGERPAAGSTEGN